MNIAGIVKNSFVDYPEKIAYVLFTQGCNFFCWFCHNSDLIDINKKNNINEEYLLKDIEKRKDFIDAVVITGGEPTLQKDLINFIKKIKELNLLVKLDTNGSNIKILNELMKKKLVDYIAMDIKIAPKYYSKYTKLNNIEQNILNSIQIIKNSKIDHEFRTTFTPDLTIEDIKNIIFLINNSKYYIQKYNTINNKIMDYQNIIAELKNLENNNSNIKLRNFF